MPLSPGSRLGPYKIIEPLGAGGMGEVYRARDPRMGREVAIKVSAERFSDRFEREVHAVASLNHPNICHIYDVGPNYLVLELIDGPTLADRMSEGAMPIEEALAIARQTGDALEAAHEKGIIHRDLKPANIKITPDGAVKVLDFGLAKIAEQAAGAGNPDESPTVAMTGTIAGQIMGTAAYMAPEQARGKRVDNRADIWAFGVVLYEMVSGIHPFQGSDLTETLASVVRDTPDLNRAPAELRHLLSRCLEKDPNRRLRHIGDVMDLVSLPVSQSKVAGVSKPNQRWPAVAALLAMTTGLSLWAPWRGESDSGTTAPVTRLAVVPHGVPDASGNNFGSALSPDGLTLAFVGLNDKNNAGLYLRDLNSLEARMIAGSEGAGRPFWSPDSKYVAWFANQTLWKTLVSGGTVEKVTSIAGAGRGGTWSRDGTILFADQNNRGINRVPAGGGTVVLVTQLDPARDEDAHYYPQFLPDGRHFLYYRRAKSGDRAGMYVGTLDDPKKGAADPLVLPSEYRAIYGSGHLIKYTGDAVVAQAFDTASLALSGSPIVIAGTVAKNPSNAYADISAADTGVLAYGAAQNNADRTLRWLDRFGKPLATVGANISDGSIIISPDGTRVLGRFSDRDRQGNWVLNLERGTRTRVTYEPSYNDAVWSPSGNEIAYLTAGAEGQVYTRAADGSGAPHTVPDGLLGRGQLTEWTTDGRLFSYGAGEQAQDIYEMPVTGGKPRILIGGPNSQGQARLSPDGRWIAYSSVESSRSEVYVAGNNGKGKWQVSANGGSTPRWRRDGREIIYSSSEGLVSVPVTLSANSVSLGKPTALFAPPGPWDLAPDFSRVLVAMPPENQDSSFIILQNWTGLLKQTRTNDNKK